MSGDKCLPLSRFLSWVLQISIWATSDQPHDQAGLIALICEMWESSCGTDVFPHTWKAQGPG